jgi:teichuronic acid biosynthesis glycosyltransferase TuaC
MFPCRRHPTSGIFFANLMRELAPRVEELTIVTPRVYIPKFLTKFKKRWAKWHLDPMSSEENNISIIRPYYPCLRGPSTEGINAIMMQLSIFNLCKEIIRKKNIELILGYNMIPEGIAAVNLARANKLPAAIWAIGTDFNGYAVRNRLNYFLVQRCIEKSSMVFTNSKDLEAKVKNVSPGKGNISTFYKGIDLSNFHDLPSKDRILNELGLDPKRKYILFVGRLIYDKGIYELAASFRCISERYSNVDLILVGEGIERDKLMATFSEYGLLDRIILKDVVPYRKVAYFMKIAEMLILPTWSEGLPNVLMEAMAIGLPVVASNVDGIPEILENGFTGLSVPPQNAAKLTEATFAMLENNELREKCVRNARKLIYDRFDVKKNVDNLYSLLRTLKA